MMGFILSIGDVGSSICRRAQKTGSPPHRRCALISARTSAISPDDPACAVGEAAASRQRRLAWLQEGAAVDIPGVPFHDLRYTDTSALIAGRLDVVAINCRLGHASLAVTLSVYADCSRSRTKARRRSKLR